jgi:hypothetical protein
VVPITRPMAITGYVSVLRMKKEIYFGLYKTALKLITIKLSVTEHIQCSVFDV